MSGERSGPSYDRRLLVLLGTVIVAGYAALRPLYSYGTSNHTSQIPLVKHLIDPSYLSADWVTAVRTGFGTPRFVYLESVAAVSSILGVPTAYAVLYVLALALGVAGLFLFVRTAFDDSLVALVVVGLVFSPIRNILSLGGTNLFSNQLIPGPIGNALVLLGLTALLRSRYWAAYISFAVATLIHIVIGTTMSGLATVALLVAVLVEQRPSPSVDGVRRTIHALPVGPILLYGAVAAVSVGPVALTNVGFEHSMVTMHVMAWIRHPHHYVPSTWALWRHVLVAAFVAFGFAVTWRTRHRVFADDRTATFCLSLGVLVALFMYVGGWVFVEVVTVPPLVKLQPFRIQNFLFVILFGVFGVNAVRVLDRHVSTSLGVSIRTLAPALAVLVFVAGFTAYGGVAGVNTELVKEPTHGESLNEAYNYISTETPEDARFLASPDKEGFRLYGERARVVDIKSFPFSPPAMLEWKDRMDDVCSVDVGTFADPKAMVGGCREHFKGSSDDKIRTLAAEYDACWLLTQRQDYAFERVFSNEKYAVYKIPDVESCSIG